MMRSNIKSRLVKLEALLAAKTNIMPNVVLVCIYERENDVVAAGIGGNNVLRQDGEPLDALTARASRELGMQFLFAIYADGIEAGYQT
jgi:hypothetical protein